MTGGPHHDVTPDTEAPKVDSGILWGKWFVVSGWWLVKCCNPKIR